MSEENDKSPIYFERDRFLLLVEKLDAKIDENAEKTQQKMDFILDRQAQFTADIQQLKELHGQAETRMTKIENIIVRLYKDSDARFNALAEDTSAKIGALVDSHMRLMDAQAKTDERLNTFINVVERYISEGRGGNSQS